MCIELSKYLKGQLKNHRQSRISAKGVYSLISSKLLDRNQMQKYRASQKNWESETVPCRTSKAMVVPQNHLFLLGLTFGLTGGYFTHLSVLSNLSAAIWGVVDHAALLYYDASHTVVFEPNWGLALWNTAAVGTCNIKTIENLLEGGYHLESAPYRYAVEVREVGWVTLGKKPATNMNTKMLT